MEKEMERNGDIEELELNERESNNGYDLSAFTPSICNHQSRAGGGAGVMSIVNSKNGKRVTLSKNLVEHLGNPKSVQIGLSNHQIAVAEYFSDEYTSYSWCTGGAKSIIYSSELVKQLTDQYGLDFRNRTSITFAEVEYIEHEGKMIALITVHP
jgi:hypothetical protein